MPRQAESKMTRWKRVAHAETDRLKTVFEERIGRAMNYDEEMQTYTKILSRLEDRGRDPLPDPRQREFLFPL